MDPSRPGLSSQLSSGPEFDRIRTLLDAGRRRAPGQRTPSETPTDAADAGIRLGPGDDAAVLAAGDLWSART